MGEVRERVVGEGDEQRGGEAEQEVEAGGGVAAQRGGDAGREVEPRPEAEAVEAEGAEIELLEEDEEAPQHPVPLPRQVQFSTFSYEEKNQMMEWLRFLYRHASCSVRVQHTVASEHQACNGHL